MKGLWSAYTVVVKNDQGETFHITTQEGVRGLNIPVEVKVDEGKWEVAHQGRLVPIEEVKKVS